MLNDFRTQERKLDQERGVEKSQIRRRRINRIEIGSAGERLSYLQRRVRRDEAQYRQINMKIDRFLMTKRDLFAFGPGLRGRGCFCFAPTIRGAAAFRPGQHEELFAGNATAPDKSGNEEQRTEQIGKSSPHALSA